MAQADGEVAAAERDLLVSIAGDLSSAEAALDAVRGETLDGLALRVERYADRFFIAMRARSCALVDGRLDPSEALAFERLVEGFQLLPDDVAKIEQVAAAAIRGEDCPPDERVRALFTASSFSEIDSGEAPSC